MQISKLDLLGLTLTFAIGIAAARPLSSPVASPTGPCDAVSREITIVAWPVVETPPAISRELTIGVPTPDLRIEAPVLPDEGNTGTRFQLRWITHNGGAGPTAGAWTDRIAFSVPIDPVGRTGPSTTFDVSQPASPALEAGEGRQVVQQFWMPATTSPDSFTITIQLDVFDELLEGDAGAGESDNLLGPHTVDLVADALPDLEPEILQDLSPTDTYVTRQTVQVQFRIRNTGDDATDIPSWLDRVEIVPAGTAMAVWDFDNASFLGAGDPYDQSVDLILPDGLINEGESQGQFQLRLSADANDLLDEEDEGNNQVYGGTFTVERRDYPNLLPTGILVGGLAWSGVSTGETYTFSWSVQNDGGESTPVAAFRDELYLSPNNNPADFSQDLLLGTAAQLVDSIAPSDSATRALTVLVPVDATITHPSTSGDYWLKVCTDVHDDIAELDALGVERDSDNCTVTAIGEMVTLTVTPNLRPTSIDETSEANLRAGHTLPVVWTVENAGADGELWNAPISWNDELWLAESPDLSSGASYSLGSFFQNTVLNGGGEWVFEDYSKSRTVRLPADASPGTYYLVVQVDKDNQVFEYGGGSLDGDNMLASAALILDAVPADLELSASAAGGTTLPPSAAAPGETIELPWSVVNGGSETTSHDQWKDRVILTRDPGTLTGEDAHVLVTQTRLGALASTEAYEVVATATVPYVTPGADWYLVFRSDHFEVLFEEDLSDNELALPFEVNDELSDLEVSQVSATGRARPGDPLQVSWTVTNEGSQATNSDLWLDRVWIADTQDPSTASEYVELASQPRTEALAPGAHYDVTLDVPLFVGLAPGLWYVGVSTDALGGSGQVFESDEGDNFLATSVQVQVDPPPPSNLVVRDVMPLADPVTAGQELAVSWTVENVGLGATDRTGWTDVVRLSADYVADASDTVIGFHLHEDSIAAGASEFVSSTFVCPPWLNGSYVLLVETDPQDLLIESGPAFDNIGFASSLLEVRAHPPSDIRIQSIAHPTTALLGEALSIDWTTVNDGSIDVPSNWQWTDDFWLLPTGSTFPNPGAVQLGAAVNDTPGILVGGTDAGQSTSLTIPGVLPGDYRLVGRSDISGVVVETLDGISRESDANVTVSSTTINLSAIPVDVGDQLMNVPLPGGESRWLRLETPPMSPSRTLRLSLVHAESSARCELYALQDRPPQLGVYDYFVGGSASAQPNIQELDLPLVGESESWFFLARVVSGGSAGGTANVSLEELPFAIDAVSPEQAGQGRVTLVLEGGQLWRAESGGRVFLRDATSLTEFDALEFEVEDGVLHALFDLSAAALGDHLVFVDDGTGEISWSGVLLVEEELALQASATLQTSGNIRRGSTASGSVTLENPGNVNVPFSVVVVGTQRPLGLHDPDERVTLTAANLGEFEFDPVSSREFLAFYVQDLGPGQEHVVDLALAVGPEWSGSEASLSLSARAAGAGSFVLGNLGVTRGLSEALRLGVIAASTSSASLLALAADSAGWHALVAAARASGALDVDSDDIFTPTDTERSLRQLLVDIGAGVLAESGLPAGNEVPVEAIDLALTQAPCLPFAGTGLSCETLFPENCAGEAGTASLTTVGAISVPSARVCFATTAPDDPNEKIGPVGVTTMQNVSANGPVTFQVHFENLSEATAWASRVEIIDPIQDMYLASSLAIHAIQIGENHIALEDSPASYRDALTIVLGDGSEMLVSISAALDAADNTFYVTLQALDPDTGLAPTSGDVGLLPPNGEGLEDQATGYVEFSVLPNKDYAPSFLGGQTSVSGVTGVNSATIIFNSESQQETNHVSNEFDAEPPTTVLSCDGVQGALIQLSWTSSDEETDTHYGVYAGVGVKSYSLYYSTSSEAGPWTPIVTETTVTSIGFAGASNTTYWFKCEATDKVDNEEAKENADVVVVTGLAAQGFQPR